MEHVISIGFIAVAALGFISQFGSHPFHDHDWDDYPDEDYWDDYDRTVRSLDPYMYIVTILFILLLVVLNAWI